MRARSRDNGSLVGGPGPDGPHETQEEAVVEQTSADDDPEVDAGRVPVDDVAAASRAIAPRRNLWIWANITTIVLVCVLAFVVGSRIAALVLAAQLAVCGGVRLVASAVYVSDRTIVLSVWMLLIQKNNSFL